MSEDNKDQKTEEAKEIYAQEIKTLQKKAA